jgi:hypothetical protein
MHDDSLYYKIFKHNATVDLYYKCDLITMLKIVITMWQVPRCNDIYTYVYIYIYIYICRHTFILTLNKRQRSKKDNDRQHCDPHCEKQKRVSIIFFLQLIIAPLKRMNGSWKDYMSEFSLNLSSFSFLNE